MKKIEEVRDIFSRSEYYKKTVLRPRQIIQPLGYNSFSKKTFNHVSKTQRQQLFQHPEDAIYRTIFNKKDFDIEQMLEIQDNSRKNIYLSGQNVSYLQRQYTFMANRKKNYQWYSDHPKQGSTKILKFVELLTYIQKYHLFHIEDYSLTNYCYFIECENLLYENYLNQLFNKQFIQYNIKGYYIKNNKKQSNASQNSMPLLEVDKTNAQQVVQLIQKINKRNKSTDCLYSGLHFFAALGKIHEPYVDYSDQQTKFLPYLQYNILLMCGLLGHNQNAIIKIYSNYKHKTNQYIFMIKSMFNKTTIVKPLLSNYLSNERFLICQGYKKSIGNKIYDHLYRNYDLLKNYGEEKFLIKSKVIFKNEYTSIINDYNNRLIIKGYKALYQKINENNSVKYIPNQKYLRQKLKHQHIINQQELLNLMFKFKQKPVQIHKTQIIKNQNQIQQGQIKPQPVKLSLINLVSNHSVPKIIPKQKEKKQKEPKQQKFSSIDSLIQTYNSSKEKKNKKTHKKQKQFYD